MNRGQDFREHDRDGGESGSSRSSTPVPSPRRNRVRATGGGARAHSTLSLLDSMERRTQRTYRYGIGLVCIGATLNWLGFAQGHGYVDPLRYLGVACVISGSFCVCMAMCRWLGKPVASRRISRLQNDDHGNGDVHVINVAVPMYIPSSHNNNNDQVKPPDYDVVVCSGGGSSAEPPPYDEAIKLNPGSLTTASSAPPPPMPTATIARERDRERERSASSATRQPLVLAPAPDNNYFRRSTISSSAALYQNHAQARERDHPRRPISNSNLNDKELERQRRGATTPMPIVSSSSNSSLLCLGKMNSNSIANVNAHNNNATLPPPPYKSTADSTCYDLPVNVTTAALTASKNATNANNSSQARRLSLESLRSTSKSTFIP